MHSHTLSTPNAIDDDALEFLGVKPREIRPEQWEQFEKGMGEMLTAFGIDLSTPGTERTPQRFVRAMYDATVGYEGDPKLLTAFPTECRGGPDCSVSQVVEGPIPFYALCEHHALPFFGHAYVGYVAHEQIIGISKLTRLVHLFARRFTVQERMGQEMADTLDRVLQPHGVAVYLEAVHLCTQMRGVREHESRTRTSFWRGVYDTDPNMRTEFTNMCKP